MSDPSNEKPQPDDPTSATQEQKSKASDHPLFPQHMTTMPHFLINQNKPTTKATTGDDGETASAEDPRLSRLMKMRSQYVTEESLSAAVKPPPQPKAPDEDLDEEYDDQEYLEDEEYHDEEEYLDEEDLEEEPSPPSTQVAQQAPEATVPEVVDEPEPEDSDHRVAQLRKLKHQFVTEKDLEQTPSSSQEPSVLLTAPTQQAKVLCPNCQSEQPRSEKICSNCGAKLPNITAIEEEKYNPGSVDTSLKKYKNAIDKLKKGELSASDFIDFLHERIELTRSLIDSLLELMEETVAAEWLPEASTLIRDATSLLEESVENMLLRVEEKIAEIEEMAEVAEQDEDADDPPDLEQAIRLLDFEPELQTVKQANDQLFEALKKIDQYQKKAQADLEVSL